jgi:GT2 family glycosyltransferase
LSPASYAITFACHNQVEYTRQCVESLVRHGYDLGRVVAVDNASRDGTRAYLEALPLGGRIHNQSNLGCGVAWNQGALALQSEWTVVMNNDVIVSAGWLEGLIQGARDRGLKLVSPALIEGALDYDFEGFCRDFGARMSNVARGGARHAMCMAIHRSVWEEVGYFRATPKLWGYEDTLFFDEIEKASIPTAILGASWVHHFGSITLRALKQERGISQRQGLGARDNYQLLGQLTLQRKWKKLLRMCRSREWQRRELMHFGMTLHGQREDGRFIWR